MTDPKSLTTITFRLPSQNLRIKVPPSDLVKTLRTHIKQAIPNLGDAYEFVVFLLPSRVPSTSDLNAASTRLTRTLSVADENLSILDVGVSDSVLIIKKIPNLSSSPSSLSSTLIPSNALSGIRGLFATIWTNFWTFIKLLNPAFAIDKDPSLDSNPITNTPRNDKEAVAVEGGIFVRRHNAVKDHNPPTSFLRDIKGQDQGGTKDDWKTYCGNSTSQM